MKPMLIVAFVTVAAACGPSRGPTAVVTRVVSTVAPTPPPPTSPPSFSVTGTWRGRIGYDYPDDWCACCNLAAYDASATFTQDGSQVSGQIHSVCFDEQFAGTLQDGQLSGAAKVDAYSVTYAGQASGPATQDRFYLGTGQLKGADGQAVSGYRITFTR
jgi:hypothetical protein